MKEKLSLVIPVYNSAGHLSACLEHLSRSTIPPDECIVVDDGSTDDSAAIAERWGAKVIRTPKRRGPAHARNRGAREATGDLLFFIDADVCVHPDTIEKLLRTFGEDPKPDCVIGSYDVAPAASDFISQYRNLMHCYVHQQSKRQACTFWTGCGAIRRSVFLEHSGFSERYLRPAIEDIELGYRLHSAGRRMILDREVQVKHLKHWTFWNVVKTDIMDRGVPWTELILRAGSLPNDLNLQLSGRLSTVLTYILTLLTIAGGILLGGSFLIPLLVLLLLSLSTYWVEVASKPSPGAMAGLSAAGLITAWLAFHQNLLLLVAPLCVAFILLQVRQRSALLSTGARRIAGLLWGVYALLVVALVTSYMPWHPIVWSAFLVLALIAILNSRFYIFLGRHMGWLYALSAVPFHLLYHFYNGVSFVVGYVRHMFRERSKSDSDSDSGRGLNRESRREERGAEKTAAQPALPQ